MQFGLTVWAQRPLAMGPAAVSAGDPDIVEVTSTATTATVSYTGSVTHYRLDGGTAVSLGASPHTITGLTADTEYTVEIGDGASTWWDLTAFGTTNPGEGGGDIGPAAITLTGSDATQASTSGTGSITQVHALTGSDAAQAAASGTGAITQVHALSGADCTQAAASGTGVVSVGGTITLTGADSTIAASSAAGAISQVHQLVSAGTAQTGSSGTGALIQAHGLMAEACTQAAISGTGAIAIGDIDTILSADWTYSVPRFGKTYAAPSFGKTYTVH